MHNKILSKQKTVIKYVYIPFPNERCNIHYLKGKFFQDPHEIPSMREGSYRNFEKYYSINKVKR